MTDTMEAPAPTVTLSLESLQLIGKRVNQLDEQISAASGSEQAVRTSVLNSIATENADTVDSILQQFLTTFRSLPVEVRVGFTHRFEDAVTDDTGAEMDAYVDERIKVLSASAKQDTQPLKDARKTAVDEFRSMKTVLEMLKIDTSSIPEPKRAGGRTAGAARTGNSAAKGFNKDRYRYSIDGKEQPPSQNTASATAFYSTKGCAGTAEKPEKWGTKTWREFIAAQGVTMGEPGKGNDTWEVTLPNGVKVSARRLDENNPADADIYAAVSSSSDDGDDDSDDEAPASDSPVAPAEQPNAEVAPQG
jgi:hypothetical protein